MSKKESPLPKPPKTPFGRKRRFEGDEKQGTLMADRMAMAMAEGKLDDFLEKEMPDSEHAKKLAEMMMGMSGMMPVGHMPEKPAPKKKASPGKNEAPSPGDLPPAAEPPEGVVDAVKGADVEGLMDLLKKEHTKRQGGKPEPVKKKKDSAPAKNQVSIEKEVIEQLIKISADNSLGLDWIVFRALKRYVEEYRKTGNL
jgi:hypothetical protein